MPKFHIYEPININTFSKNNTFRQGNKYQLIINAIAIIVTPKNAVYNIFSTSKKGLCVVFCLILQADSAIMVSYNYIAKQERIQLQYNEDELIKR